MKDKELREAVRERYGSIAGQGSSCCAPAGSCGGAELESQSSIQSASETIGYSREEISSVPEGSDLGLGCGNPLALASLKGGETVLDLGSGAGFDCFLAAKRVGENGRVIGVDMTPEMVEKARENARKGGYKNVEFRLGEIENLPAADSSVDLIISNCVVNLAVDKTRVFEEAYRVLKPGGRLMISDIVLLKELPKYILESVSSYVGCISGALMRDSYLELIRKAGFSDIEVVGEKSFGANIGSDDPLVQSAKKVLNISDREVDELGRQVLSISVSALK